MQYSAFLRFHSFMLLLHCVGISEASITQEFNGFIFSNLKVVIEKSLVYFSASGNNNLDIKKKFQLISVTSFM